LNVTFHLLVILHAVHVHEGDGDAAARDCLCMLHMGRSVADETILWSQGARANAWVRLPIRGLERTLAQCEVSDAALAVLQSRFADEVANDIWKVRLRGERALWHRIMLAVQGGTLKPSSL